MRKIGGVKTPHLKSTANSRGEYIPVSSAVTIPMKMHIGTPAKCIVAVGEYVKIGQLIGRADGTASANVHASVSGTVTHIEETDRATGKRELCVTIKSDGLRIYDESIFPHPVNSREEYLQAVRDSGVVGLGGAAAPTGPKLTLEEAANIDYLIVNGAECEPYMTCDTRTMLEDHEYLWQGVQHIKRFLKIPNIVIAIEKNKPEPIRIMREHAEREPIASVFVLPELYPQGSKKSLIYNITGRVVPEGKRPRDVGCVVINCSTLAYIERYISDGTPMISKRVTVDGTAVKSPCNVLVPLGTPISDVFAACGLTDDARKIVAGGPMMGSAVPSLEMSVIKGMNTLLAFREADATAPAESPCIRCGRCVSHCPMGLMVVDIQEAYFNNQTELLEKLHPGLCMECGCCSFTCPAKRQLTQYIKLAKSTLRTYTSRRAEGTE